MSPILESLKDPLAHDFLKPFGDIANENFAAILWAPNDVIFAAVHDIFVRLVYPPCLKAGALRRDMVVRRNSEQPWQRSA